MTMATILVLNGVAVVSLLALLAATMRLPFYLPSSSRSGAVEGDRRRETSPATRRSRPERGAPEPVYSR